MASWSRRRRLSYASIVGIFFLIVMGVPAFLIYYKAPSCTDGVLNGTEQGVDCGGKCARLCPSAFLPPQVAWTRFEIIAPELYNIATYVVNPNTDAEARNVPYHIALYDVKGILILDLYGKMTLPPHRNTLAFQGAVNVGKRIPAKVFFEFTSIPDWNKRSDSLSGITVLGKEYTEDDRGGSLLVTLKNNRLSPLGRMSVYAVLYDGSGNALGFSKTIIDEIPGQGTAVAPFTWPTVRHDAVVSIEVLPVAE
jgi:hypothetical protein